MKLDIQRIRVPLGFLFGILFFWLAPRSPALSPSSLVVGGVVALLGLAMRAWAAGHIVKNDRLATTGPYAHTRNPLYFGSFLLAAGFAIAAYWPLLAAVVVFWLVVYVPVIEREAAYVRSRHPESYDEWAANVPRFFPRLSPWRAPGAQPAEAGGGFSPALYFRHKEWQAGVASVVIMGWLVFSYLQRA